MYSHSWTQLFLTVAVTVQMLSPGTSRTFQEHVVSVYKPLINKPPKVLKRVDIVWDVYLQDSLKSTTRLKRCSRQTRKVLPPTHVPLNWRTFLCVDGNKTELFHLLAQQTVAFPLDDEKEIYCTFGERFLTLATTSDMTPLEPSNHEEADTHIMLHVLDAYMSSYLQIMIRANDSCCRSCK